LNLITIYRVNDDSPEAIVFFSLDFHNQFWTTQPDESLNVQLVLPQANFQRSLVMDSGIKQEAEESPDNQPASPISQSPNATLASLHPTYHTDVGVEDSMHVVTTQRRISNPVVDANTTLAGEPLAEQTLVESMHGGEDEKEEERKHKRNSSNTSFSYIKKEDQSRRGEDEQVWNHTMDIVDVTGKTLALYDNHSDAGSQKELPLRVKGNGRSLRLDLSKDESTMPWERIDPPLDTDVKAITGYYSPTASQRKLTTGHVVIPSYYQKQDCKVFNRQRQMIPKSSYYFGPPGPDSAYGTAPVGQIGVHHPREILRVERDYTGGELIQFTAIYPLELEGRVRLFDRFLILTLKA